MRLYVKTPAPSVLKVLIFADESGHALEELEVTDVRSAEFLKLNPFGTVPVLETDTGEPISESLTICRYLDRIWDSGLFGRTAHEKLQVELWERRADLQLYTPAVEYVHQVHPMFAGRIEQHPEWAKVLAGRAQRSAEVFGEQLNGHKFIASDSFSMADITGFLGLSAFAAFGAVDMARLPSLRRWSEEIGARPSMQRLRILSA